MRISDHMFWARNHITYHWNARCQLLLLYNSLWIMCLSASMQMLHIVSCLGLLLLSLCLVPVLTFFNTVFCIQFHFWSINPKFIQLQEKHLTSYYLYFPNLNKYEMLNFLRVWCNKIRSCYLLDHGIVWSAMQIGYKQLNQ